MQNNGESHTSDSGLEVHWLHVEDLRLDPLNPRVGSISFEDEPSQRELEQALWTEMAVDELVLSIAANAMPCCGELNDAKLETVPDLSIRYMYPFGTPLSGT